MARRIRPYLPGVTFHLTARVHGREALFTPELRTAIVAYLREQVAFTDVQLFAYAIMPNHLHLVLRQRQVPLWRFMQPLLRRTALLLQRTHGREGHVFERRYRDHPCGDPEYIRNAIVYTHLNPVRAGLCTEPGDYAWSSHGGWLRDSSAADGDSHPVSLELPAQLFASGPARDSGELSLDYQAFLNWRREIDRLQASADAGEPLHPLPARPQVGYGDEEWVVYLPNGGEWASPSMDTACSAPASSRGRRSDLEHIARGVVRDGKSGPDPTLVRSRWGGVAHVRARHEIIRRAAASGYSGVDIAAFLRISPGAVYAVLAAERRKLLPSTL